MAGNNTHANPTPAMTGNKEMIFFALYRVPRKAAEIDMTKMGVVDRTT